MSNEVEMIEVGGKEYAVIKTGRAQAEQVVKITRWISVHGMKAVKALRTPEGTVEAGSGIELIGSIIGELSADALIDLYAALIGCPNEDAEVYFDVATLVDVAIMVYEGQPSVRRLMERFFSTSSSEQDTPAE